MEYGINKLNAHITQLSDPTEVSCFLVEGTERAVLIDTGIGLCGLKETVEGLTDKPYTVLLTHGHGDHAGGCAAFEEVYVGMADHDLIYAHGMEMRKGYTDMMLAGISQMKGITLSAGSEDYIPEPAADKEYKPLKNGDVFDLGGMTVEIIAVPGHTRGTVCMLFPEERAILFGDACNPNTLVAGEKSTTISEYKKSLEYLKTFESRYDTVYYSHGPAIAPSALDDNIELCGKILAGTDDHVPERGIGGDGFIAAKREGFMRVDGKFGNIFYSELTRK